jgi:hypothetical protein
MALAYLGTGSATAHGIAALVKMSRNALYVMKMNTSKELCPIFTYEFDSLIKTCREHEAI